MSSLSIEGVSLFLTLLLAIFGANAFLWNKLDQIWHAISTLRRETVTHDACRRHRQSCRRR